jgi:hypothetical protein
VIVLVLLSFRMIVHAVYRRDSVELFCPWNLWNEIVLLHYISWNISCIHININIKCSIIHFSPMRCFNLNKFEIDINNLTSLLIKSESKLALRITYHKFDK